MDRRSCAEGQELPQVRFRCRTSSLPVRYSPPRMGRLHLLPQPPPQGTPSSAIHDQHHPRQGYRRKASLTMLEPVSSVRGSPKDARGLQFHIHSHWQGRSIARPATISPRPCVGSVVRLPFRPDPFPRPTRTPLLGCRPAIPTTCLEINHPCSFARPRGGNQRGL